MFYNWIYHFHDYIPGLEIVRYISFRAGLAAITAFLISIFIGAKIIKILQKYNVSEDTTKKDSEILKDLHKSKKNVPTMGGVIILIAILISTLMWCNIFNIYVLMMIFTTVWLGILGFFDDYIKLTRKHSSGLAGTSKLLAQCSLGLILGLVLYFHFSNISDVKLVAKMINSLGANAKLMGEKAYSIEPQNLSKSSLIESKPLCIFLKWRNNSCGTDLSNNS